MITHIIYHVPSRRKVGCTADIAARKMWYPKDTAIEILEELHDKTDQEAGDIEWVWADRFGYQRRKHYVDAILMGKSEGSLRTMSSDAISELNRRSAFKMTPEQRTERGKKAGAGSIRGLTPEQLSKRMRRANEAMISMVVKCPHCEFEGTIAMAKRWHFDNCPHKPKVSKPRLVRRAP